MKKQMYQNAEVFFNALPDARQASTCKQAENSPVSVKYLVLMNDQFDMVAKASKYIFLLKEQHKEIPVVILAGGYNRWMRCHNNEIMAHFALHLGIKNSNLRTLDTDGSIGDAVNKLRKNYGLDKMVFVTNRLWYRPLFDYLQKYRKDNQFYFYVGNDKLEDLLNWVNGNAAGRGLYLLHKIARYYAYVPLDDPKANAAKDEIANAYYLLGFWQKCYLHFSFWLHRKRILRHQEVMIRFFRKSFRERNWTY